MKDKRAAGRNGDFESKENINVLAHHGAGVSNPQKDISHREYLAGITSVILSITGAVGSLLSVYYVSSDLPQIPQAYASLVAVVVASTVGISVTFLLVRFIYQKRKSEREEILRKVRTKEKRLFEMLDLDFGSTIRRDLDAGQTN